MARTLLRRPNPPRHRGGGWATEFPVGPNGRGLCRWCRAEVPRGRRTFCGQPCVDQHLCRANASGAAKVLLRRDRGVCTLCRLDCEALRRRVRRTWGPERSAILLAAGVPPALHYRRRLWDVDHVVPVAEGGGSCGPEGLRTLCIRCHMIVTAELRARLAARARLG